MKLKSINKIFKHVLSLGLISLFLCVGAHANEGSSDSFDKYRQQALDAAKSSPSLPESSSERRQQQNNYARPPQPPIQNPNVPQPYAVPPTSPSPSPGSAPTDKTKMQQSNQPANIWLKPNPWGNTTNNPWAPRQQPSTLPKDEKQPADMSKQQGATEAPKQHNIFAPRN